jgi:hypothetical protein
VYTVRSGSDIAEAQIAGLADAEIDALVEIYEVLRLTPDNGRKLGPASCEFAMPSAGCGRFGLSVRTGC